METALKGYHSFHQSCLSPPFTTTPDPPRPPITTSNSGRRLTRNVGHPMRELAVKRVGIAINPFRLNCSSPFSAAMADAKKTSTQSEDLTSPVKEGVGEMKDLDKSKKINVPPPPEKPLPGDCCGSGCVRCVWDVYYEELEAYNKFYKTSP